MNEFKESLKVVRKNSGEIIITEQLKSLLIELMKGNIFKKELMEITGIGDEGSVERKIEEIVGGKDKEKLKPLYDEYISKKRENFEGYEFRAEAIEMLRRDYSQSVMAKLLGIPRKSFSTKMKKLQEKNKENILGDLLKEHAERKMKRQEITDEEIIKINLALDEYEEQFPVGLVKYEKRTSQEVRKQTLEKVISAIENMRAEGMTLQQISERKIISEGMYRKYKAELENLIKILDGNGEEEKEQ